METLPKLAHVGCDLHQKFTIATAREAQKRLVWRKRLEHADPPQLRAQLGTWPKGTPVLLQATCGCDAVADSVQAARGAGLGGRRISRRRYPRAVRQSQPGAPGPHGAPGCAGRAPAAAAGDRLRVGVHAGRGDRADRTLPQRQASSVVQSAGATGARRRRAGGRAPAGSACRVRRTPDAEGGVERGDAGRGAAGRPVPAVVGVAHRRWPTPAQPRVDRRGPRVGAVGGAGLTEGCGVYGRTAAAAGFAAAKRNALVRERASPWTRGSGSRSSVAAGRVVSGPPAPDELRGPRVPAGEPGCAAGRGRTRQHAWIAGPVA